MHCQGRFRVLLDQDPPVYTHMTGNPLTPYLPSPWLPSFPVGLEDAEMLGEAGGGGGKGVQRKQSPGLTPTLSVDKSILEAPT